MQLLIIGTSLIIYIIAIGIISVNTKKRVIEDSQSIVDLYAREVAQKIQANLNENLTILKTLSDAFYLFDDFEKDSWQNTVNKMYNKIFINNPQVYSLWDSWELKYIDPTWDKDYGRISNAYWRENGVVKNVSVTRSLDGDHGEYVKTKSLRKPSISEPYIDVADGEREANLMMSLKAPILKEGKFAGVIAFDFTLDQLQNVIQRIDLFEGSYAFLVSNKGIISSHKNKKLLNKNIVDIFPNDNINYRVKDCIKKGEILKYMSVDEDGSYFVYVPIKIKHTDTPWSIAISVPVKTISQTAQKEFTLTIIIGTIGLLLMSVIIYFLVKGVINPIEKITSMLKELSHGNIVNDEMQVIHTGDEIEEMSKALNYSIEGLSKKVQFAENIGCGNLNSDYEVLSENDILGKSLLNMRESLRKAEAEANVRADENQKRQWANEGIAKFSSIMRETNDINQLGNQIIMNLVNYLDANQGGVFLLDENAERPMFNLISAYAYDRTKFLKKSIELNEGLIGRCAIEKQSIYMTDIPNTYLKITSGLGGANPRSLLICPLIANEEVIGVIELASFNNIENYQIEFVEKITEIIASALLAIKTNLRTEQLLKISQEQTEELAAHEEEMRQNLEELKATQEESLRRSSETEGLIYALNESSYVIEYNLDGYINNINDKYLSLLNISKNEIMGTHHSRDVVFSDSQKRKYEKFWSDLRSGMIKTEKTKIKIHNKEYEFNETYTPIKDYNGDVSKILKISFIHN